MDPGIFQHVSFCSSWPCIRALSLLHAFRARFGVCVFCGFLMFAGLWVFVLCALLLFARSRFRSKLKLAQFRPIYHLLQSAGCRPVPSCVRKLLVSISGCLSCSSCFADLLWFCSASLSLCRCSRFRFLPSARYCSFVCLAPVFRSHPSTRIRPGFDLMLLSTWHLRQTSFFC